MLPRLFPALLLASATLAGFAACSTSETEPTKSTSDAGSAGDAAPATDAQAGSASDAGGEPAADASAEDAGVTDAGADAEVAAFAVASTSFVAEGAIPALHTCTGSDVSPALAWTGAPAGTQSYAVVMRDLSLAGANYHWVIYDIPASVTSLAAGVDAVASPATPAGAKQTYWSFGASYGYGGPCPPAGAPHTYQFEVLAFATATVAVPANTTSPSAADAVLQAAKTASTTIRGTYQR